MPMYVAKIPGAKPVYLRAASAAKASAMLVDVTALKSEEILEAFDKGAKTFKEGDQIELADAPEIVPNETNSAAPPTEGGKPKA